MIRNVVLGLGLGGALFYAEDNRRTRRADHQKRLVEEHRRKYSEWISLWSDEEAYRKECSDPVYWGEGPGSSNTCRMMERFIQKGIELAQLTQEITDKAYMDAEGTRIGAIVARNTVIPYENRECFLQRITPSKTFQAALAELPADDPIFLPLLRVHDKQDNLDREKMERIPYGIRGQVRGISESQVTESFFKKFLWSWKALSSPK